MLNLNNSNFVSKINIKRLNNVYIKMHYPHTNNIHNTNTTAQIFVIIVMLTVLETFSNLGFNDK